MKLPHVVSVFKPLGNKYVLVEKHRTKTIYCAKESVEDFQCSCGFVTPMPFKMLEHLRDFHKLHEFLAIDVWDHRFLDSTREFMEVKKGEKIPEGIKIVDIHH